MPKFGKASLEKLKTVHPDLVKVLNVAIQDVDFTILEGHRGKELQNLYFAQGKSKIKWPKGKHNKTPSLAVDIAPWPIDWKDVRQFTSLAFYIKGIAFAMGIRLRIGADWNGNFKADDSFVDGPHLEAESRLVNGKWIKY